MKPRFLVFILLLTFCIACENEEMLDEKSKTEIWNYNLITRKYSQITGIENDHISTDWGKIKWIDGNKFLSK